jgi:hypothetical protein
VWLERYYWQLPGGKEGECSLAGRHRWWVTYSLCKDPADRYSRAFPKKGAKLNDSGPYTRYRLLDSRLFWCPPSTDLNDLIKASKISSASAHGSDLAQRLCCMGLRKLPEALTCARKESIDPALCRPMIPVDGRCLYDIWVYP